jgi:hypothetical protein
LHRLVTHLCVILSLKEIWCKIVQSILDLHENNNDQLLIVWWTDFATNIEFMVFYFMGKQSNCVRNVLLLGCSLKLHVMIGHQLLKLSRCNVHMLPYFLSKNWNDDSPTKNWWIQHASFIFNIGSILSLKKHIEDIWPYWRFNFVLQPYHSTLVYFNI